MPWFEDLQPCTAFPGAWRNLLAVGWLAQGHEFTRGVTDPGLPLRLDHFRVWRAPGAPTGVHVCDLCAGDQRPRSGSGAIFVPGDGVLYVAPRLIGHYVRKHGYAPPPEFLRAVQRWRDPFQPGFSEAIELHFTPGEIEPPPPPPIDVRDWNEAVRRRPGMYLGSTTGQGLAHMLFELVSNSLDQHLAGHASQLRISVDDRGWVTVEDDGAGIPIEEPAALVAIFTRLHSGATLDGHHPHVHVQKALMGVGISAVNALCSRLEVESRRAGVAYGVTFAFGRIIEPLAIVGPTTERGTRIRYLPDEDLFEEDARLDLKQLEHRVLELARLCPRLELVLQGRSLENPAGLSGWVVELAPDLIKETSLSAMGKVNDVDVEVALAWNPKGTAPQVLSFVNYARTVEAGSHEQGLISAIKASVPRGKSGIKKQVLAGLVAVVHVRMLDPRFQGAIKVALEADEARVAVHDVVTRAISNAPWWWDRLHESLP